MTRPMLLRNMLTQLDGSLIPDAIYCDGDKWNQVADPVTLGHIAQDYLGGGIKKTLHWRAFTRDYECPPPLLS